MNDNFVRIDSVNFGNLKNRFKDEIVLNIMRNEYYDQLQRLQSLNNR